MNDDLKEDLLFLQKVIDEQANDESLWFEMPTITEFYLQGTLRNLHRLIEEITSKYI